MFFEGKKERRQKIRSKDDLRWQRLSIACLRRSKKRKESERSFVGFRSYIDRAKTFESLALSLRISLPLFDIDTSVTLSTTQEDDPLVDQTELVLYLVSFFVDTSTPTRQERFYS